MIDTVAHRKREESLHRQENLKGFIDVLNSSTMTSDEQIMALVHFAEMLKEENSSYQTRSGVKEKYEFLSKHGAVSFDERTKRLPYFIETLESRSVDHVDREDTYSAISERQESETPDIQTGHKVATSNMRIPGVPPLEELLKGIENTESTKSCNSRCTLISMDVYSTQKIHNLNPSAHICEVQVVTQYQSSEDVEKTIMYVLAPTARRVHASNPQSQLVFCHSRNIWDITGTHYLPGELISKYLTDIPSKIVLWVGPQMQQYAMDIIQAAT